jgi:hypothetical protein
MRFRQNADNSAEIETGGGDVVRLSADEFAELVDGVPIPVPSVTLGAPCGVLRFDDEGAPRFEDVLASDQKPSMVLFLPPGGPGSWVDVPEDCAETISKRLERGGARPGPGGKA